MDEWRNSTERHEQIALGWKLAGSEAKLGKWLDEVDKKMRGKSE